MIPSHWILLRMEIEEGRAKPEDVEAIARKEPEFAKWLTQRTQDKINAMIAACEEIPEHGPDRGNENGEAA